MIDPVLRTLGLSRVEQELYEALVALRSATHAEISTLADDAEWGQEAAAAALTRLLDLKLVSPLRDAPTQYAAAPPAAALETMLAARTQELAHTRERIQRLNTRFYDRTNRRSTNPWIEVVHGRDAISRWLADLYDDLHSELAGYDAPPYIGEPDVGNMRRANDPRQHVEFRILYDPTALTIAGRAQDVSTEEDDPGGEVRIGDVPMKMYLADRRVAVMPLDQSRVHDALLVVRDPPLLRLMYVLFDEYWNRALPLSNSGRFGRQAVVLTTSDRELLVLLASGYNDRVIADQLGWAPRTVSRRVARLMRGLGVTTRFQAGYQAVLRGWIGPFAEHEETSSQTPATQL